MMADKKWDFVKHVPCGTPVELRQVRETPDNMDVRPIEVRCPKCDRLVDTAELSHPGPYSATW